MHYREVSPDAPLHLLTGGFPPQRLKEEWANGLRGLAALLVACHHFVVTFNTAATLSPSDDDGTVHFWQWPVIRALINPNFLVSIFYVLSGFVLSAKPLLILNSETSGSSAAVRNLLASACFKRPFRLFPCVAVSMCLVYSLLLMGGFEAVHSKQIGTSWAFTYAASMTTDSWYAQLLDMFARLLRLWSDPTAAAPYNTALWTMGSELSGSILVYVFLMATSQIKRRFRIGLAIGLWGYYVFCYDTVKTQFMSGLLLADWHTSRTTAVSVQPSPRPSRIGCVPSQTIVDRSLWVLHLAFALFCGSFPYERANRRPWSEMMLDFLSPFCAGKHLHISGIYNTIGSALLVLAVLLSARSQKLLSTPPLVFLGRVSFALYLIHVPLLLSIGVATAVAFINVIHIGYTLSIMMMAPIWMGLTIGLSMLITQHVDEVCVKWGRGLEHRLSR